MHAWHSLIFRGNPFGLVVPYMSLPPSPSLLSHLPLSLPHSTFLQLAELEDDTDTRFFNAIANPSNPDTRIKTVYPHRARSTKP